MPANIHADTTKACMATQARMHDQANMCTLPLAAGHSLVVVSAPAGILADEVGILAHVQ